MMEIKVEKFLMKQGNRVGKAAIQFTTGPLAGFHLVGFTICEDPDRIFVLFPAAMTEKKEGESKRPFFFLRPDDPKKLDDLQDAIIDVYESLAGSAYANRPRMKQEEVVKES